MKVVVSCIYAVVVGITVPLNIFSEKRWIRIFSLLVIVLAVIIRCWFLAEEGI